jgi:hypothetical protein
MNAGMSFGATEQDIETVLRENAAIIARPKGKPIALMATEIHAEFDAGDQERVTQAAQNAGTGIIEQIDAAHDEIRAVLVERGILKPRMAPPETR